MMVLKTLKMILLPKYHSRFFLVGGMVRDFLLNKENQDVDLVTDVAPDVLISLGFRPVNPKSATQIYFHYHDELGKIEITRLEPGQSLADELCRRDFTINAMAMSLDGEILDPLNGRSDLEKGQLRVCSEQAFLNDPIRIFRACRFEAGGWSLTLESEKLIRRRNWETDLAKIPIERFSNEMLKALQSKHPDKFFSKMVELNVGRAMLPEIFRMREIPAGPVQYHPEADLLIHSLETLKRMTELSDEPIPRFCALFHDLGKLATEPEQYPKHIGHDQAGYAMATEFCNRLKLSASMRKGLLWTCRLHLSAARWDKLRDSTKVRLAKQANNGGISEFLDLIVSADRGVIGTMRDWETALKVVSLSSEELGIQPELLSGAKAIPICNRSALIHQYQVERFRLLTQFQQASSSI